MSLGQHGISPLLLSPTSPSLHWISCAPFNPNHTSTCRTKIWLSPISQSSQGIKPSGLGGMEGLALRHWHPSARSASAERSAPLKLADNWRKILWKMWSNQSAPQTWNKSTYPPLLNSHTYLLCVFVNISTKSYFSVRSLFSKLSIHIDETKQCKVHIEIMPNVQSKINLAKRLAFPFS